MKHFIRFVLLAAILIVAGCQQKQVENTYDILPLPNQMTRGNGRFDLKKCAIVSTAGCSDEVKAIADSMIAKIKTASGIKWTQTGEIPETNAVSFVTDKNIPQEGYHLQVTPEKITIKASRPNGFFYAVQTLYQLLPTDIYSAKLNRQVSWSVPAVDIQDAPRFAYRGMMLDPCRNFFTIDYIYKYIDVMAMHKMNTLHLHLTDDQGWRLEIKSLPKLTEIGSKRKGTLAGHYYQNYPQEFDGRAKEGFYTQEEMKALVAYAASKYITVIPEIDMPGHGRAAIASYPELSCTPDSTYEVMQTWGVSKQVYCPKETTFSFLEKVMDEVLEIFPSKYIHIGGDECPKTAWENCRHCQSLIRKLGLRDDVRPNPIDNKKHSKEEKLQSYIVTRMEKYLNSKGRDIIGWDEILEGGLAPNATVMSWRGIEGGMTAAKAGHNAIMTPSEFVYLDLYQEDADIAPVSIYGYTTLMRTYSYNPVEDDASEEVKKHIIGLQANLWTEYVQSDERRDYQAFPRGLAVAEIGWTDNANKSWEGFCQRLVNAYDRMDRLNVHACRNFFDVLVNTQVRQDTLKVVMKTYYPEGDIRYTTNGEEPNRFSSLYTEPFTLDTNIELKAAVFNSEGKQVGKVRSKHLYGNLISGRKFTTSPKMASSGDVISNDERMGADTLTMGLTNGKRGYNTSYNPWVVFPMNDKCHQVVFTVNLDKPTEVRKVVAGSLFNPPYRIMPFSALKVEVSADNKTFTEVANKEFERNLPRTGKLAFTDEVTFKPATATYVRLTFSNGRILENGIDCPRDVPGEWIQPDLYLDEIEIY